MAAVYVVTAVQSGSALDNLQSSSLANAWVLYTPAGGLWRIFTYALLHQGLTHLIMNGFLLYFFAGELERVYGYLQVVALFVVLAIGSADVILLMDPLSATVGASGAIFGFFAVSLVLAIKHHGQIRTMVAFIVVNLAYTVLTPGVSLWGHVGGLIAGALVGVALVYGTRAVGFASVKARNQAAVRRWVILAVSFVVFVGAAYLLAV
ncbi:MAG: rhomboid family intramembrane serine protease [Corynebacterium sp.]|nr:rhomboid family intramembrane serine protease [Corynebacterium sp.]